MREFPLGRARTPWTELGTEPVADGQALLGTPPGLSPPETGRPLRAPPGPGRRGRAAPSGAAETCPAGVEPPSERRRDRPRRTRPPSLRGASGSHPPETSPWNAVGAEPVGAEPLERLRRRARRRRAHPWTPSARTSPQPSPPPGDAPEAWAGAAAEPTIRNHPPLRPPSPYPCPVTPADLSRAVLSAVRSAVDGGELAVAVPERVVVERPGPGGVGEWASNVALRLAREAGRPPREVAEVLRSRLAAEPGVAGVEVTGPGFLNVTSAGDPVGTLVTRIAAEGARTARATPCAARPPYAYRRAPRRGPGWSPRRPGGWRGRRGKSAGRGCRAGARRSGAAP